MDYTGEKQLIWYCHLLNLVSRCLQGDQPLVRHPLAWFVHSVYTNLTVIIVTYCLFFAFLSNHLLRVYPLSLKDGKWRKGGEAPDAVKKLEVKQVCDYFMLGYSSFRVFCRKLNRHCWIIFRVPFFVFFSMLELKWQELFKFSWARPGVRPLPSSNSSALCFLSLL